MMGVETTTWTEFSESEVTFKIREVPGPDHLTPYEVIVHAPFQQDVSGTIQGTNYEVTWKAVAPGEDLSPHLDFSKSLHGPAPSGPAGPVINSVSLSPHELMMVPHDARLAYDIQRDSESGSGDWIRFQSKGPAGDVVQVFRIQVVDDPKLIFASAEEVEEDLRAICAPYLSNSQEKRCNIQNLKGASCSVCYCLLTRDALAQDPTPGPGHFEFLFLGLFRISDSVALVVGNLSHKDDVNFRMMMETLGRISTLPTIPGKSADPQ